MSRQDLEHAPIVSAETDNDLLARDEVLAKFENIDRAKAALVKRCDFAAFNIPQAAEVLRSNAGTFGNRSVSVNRMASPSAARAR